MTNEKTSQTDVQNSDPIESIKPAEETITPAADKPHDKSLSGRSDHMELHSPLLECLVIYTKLNRSPFSKESLIAGLPIEKDIITPELFVRAAERANLVASFKERSIENISNLVLPCILTLKNNEA